MTENEVQETQLAVSKHQHGQISVTADLRPMTVQEMTSQINLIQDMMRATMKEGEHFGTIPGCGPKPTLLQPGAQKLLLVFKMNPDYDVEIIPMSNDHRDYKVKCILTNNAGVFIGSGVGSCSTMESKYRYRQADRLCPECGKATIIKGKAEYGGGWLCFAKKGGCGQKFDDHDPVITDQHIGRIDNPDIADTYNTCLKMAKKRALVDATLTRTAASDIFTQDIEEMPHLADDTKPHSQPQPQKQSSAGVDRLRKALFPDGESWPPKQYKGTQPTTFDISLPTAGDNPKMDWAGLSLDDKTHKAVMIAFQETGFKTEELRYSMIKALYKAFDIPQKHREIHSASMTKGHGTFLLSCLNHPHILILKKDESPPWMRPTPAATEAPPPTPEAPASPDEVDLDPDMDLEEDEDFFTD